MAIMHYSLILCMNINRDILECKCTSILECQWRRMILIETYWNVNLCARIVASCSTSNINRDILECKFIRIMVDWRNRQTILIETYWNVN